MTYLEGARFKLQSALLELDHKPRGSHPLASHIQITRDRTGLQQSILKVPLWLKREDDDDFKCTDENLTGKLSTRLGRSKSNIDQSNNVQSHALSTNVPAACSIISNSNANENLEFDRGIADGGSNQQNSDFGILFIYSSTKKKIFIYYDSRRRIFIIR